MQETGGLRERQKSARRGALIDATHELIREHGLDNVTVEAICDRVGVSVRTFFNYFDSKDDAALGVTPWTFDEQIAEDFAAGGPTGRLPEDVCALVEHMLDRPTLTRERLSGVIEIVGLEPRLVARQMAAYEMVRHQLKALAARRFGTEEPGPREELVSIVAFQLAHAALAFWAAEHATGDPTDHLPRARAELRELIG